MFQDTAQIIIKSGKGGDGHVSFRREKFVPAGGPDGGDGGKGGDIIFEITDNLNTLSDFRQNRKFCAAAGEPGEKRKCHGKDGDDMIIKVPEGTVIRDAESGKIIADMSGNNRHVVILRGGKGGLGNMNFATPTMQAPNYAKPGQPGKELSVKLELKIIADVGLIGFPNAGKSTLLSRVSNARPEIANYPFTTITPHLGVVDLGDGNGFVMADMPGLIEGASEGVGLGYNFLKHIERTKILVIVADAASTEGRDPVSDIRTILKELEKYDKALLEKPRIIAANKTDCITPDMDDPLGKIRKEFEPGTKVCAVSGVSGAGIKELISEIWSILKTMDRKPVVFEPEMEVDYSSDSDLPYTVKKDENGVFVVEGPRIEKMFGYTNLQSEKGFDFFQKFLKTSGILDDLEKNGIREGDTVRMYGHEFDYYR